MSTLLVSSKGQIVIPAELRRRLVSVLEATGRTFEILFVDDGSRDGSSAFPSSAGAEFLLRTPMGAGRTAR